MIFARMTPEYSPNDAQIVARRSLSDQDRRAHSAYYDALTIETAGITVLSLAIRMWLTPLP
jgi:hypothetical protein